MKLTELRQWITANTKTSWGTRKTTLSIYPFLVMLVNSYYFTEN